MGEKEREPGGEQEKSEKPAEQKSEENSEELVQEVCWDEKGMTWHGVEEPWSVDGEAGLDLVLQLQRCSGVDSSDVA